MAIVTTAQITTEFITRAEKYINDNFLEVVKRQELGEDYEDTLFKMEGLFQFLVELQGLYNQWTERDIRTMIDYWDSTCDLKTLMGAIPDPYKSYENIPVITTSSTVISVPGGVGLLFKDGNGNIILIEDANIINSFYGLE